MMATDRIVAFLSLCGRFGTKLFSLVFLFLKNLSNTKNNNNKKKEGQEGAAVSQWRAA
jgi:hypothetical protein